MTLYRKRLIAGNWKMNLNHFEASALVKKIASALPDILKVCLGAGNITQWAYALPEQLAAGGAA